MPIGSDSLTSCTPSSIESFGTPYYSMSMTSQLSWDIPPTARSDSWSSSQRSSANVSQGTMPPSLHYAPHPAAPDYPNTQYPPPGQWQTAPLYGYERDTSSTVSRPVPPMAAPVQGTVYSSTDVHQMQHSETAPDLMGDSWWSASDTRSRSMSAGHHASGALGVSAPSDAGSKIPTGVWLPPRDRPTHRRTSSEGPARASWTRRSTVFRDLTMTPASASRDEGVSHSQTAFYPNISDSGGMSAVPAPSGNLPPLTPYPTPTMGFPPLALNSSAPAAETNTLVYPFRSDNPSASGSQQDFWPISSAIGFASSTSSLPSTQQESSDRRPTHNLGLNRARDVDHVPAYQQSPPIIPRPPTVESELPRASLYDTDSIGQGETVTGSAASSARHLLGICPTAPLAEQPAGGLNATSSRRRTRSEGSYAVQSSSPWPTVPNDPPPNPSPQERSLTLAWEPWPDQLPAFVAPPPSHLHQLRVVSTPHKVSLHDAGHAHVKAKP